MSPILLFAFWLIVVALLGWYCIEDFSGRRPILGLILSGLLISFCLQQVWPPSGKIPLGLDLQGGSSFLIKLVCQPGEKITREMLWQAVEVVRQRIDLLGVNEPIIAPQGENCILVQVPGIETPQQIEETKTQLQRMAKLEFASIHPESQRLILLIESGQGIIPPGYIVKTEQFRNSEGNVHTVRHLVRKRPEVTGNHVASAHIFFDQQGYGVSLRLDSEGAKLFDGLAETHLGQPLAILLDGQIQSTPILKARHYGGAAQITGNFTEQQARYLANILQNPLRIPVEIEEIRSVSATLGRDSVHQGLIAGSMGVTLVMVFTGIYYRLAGLIALFGLAVNMLLLLGMMAMFRFVFTLPGIAGVILTIGMSVDASVLIYERLREELRTRKALDAALHGAYEKAFSAILDANATTLLAAIILFWQATGTVRGFAITLTLGIITSLFSSLIVTRTLLHWVVTKGYLRKLHLLDWIPKWQFDFLGKQKLAVGISLLLLIGTVVFLTLRGRGNFGIDFLGGDLLVMQCRQPFSIKEVHRELEQLGFGETISVQLAHGIGPEKLVIQGPKGSSKAIIAALSDTFSNRGLQVVQQDTVGARVGREFAKKSTFALGLSIAAILCYVAMRFEFAFALGAVVAVVHDVLITIGLFAFTGGVFSLILVGAVLIVAGYSVNDTIVVFDRIREKWSGSKSLRVVEALVNQSINETLGRTVLTGGTTLLSVAALYFIGGEILRDFAFTILVGVFVGTYSSVFVASPVAVWYARRKRKIFGASYK
ncbi:Protein translocase subunit SecD [Candidatus Xiphinematobacter sp. Idaho Grape]|uniref:protein translocase subunit SecD n=1 Tax=Candidatus Xiphinematobacter sp. Idaho Grape TaxID=1704307 RepID=UPI0007069D9E|nr:protein translocase subunit SecD [Candidatus Xiphinematobacter sp. Idaho Grape]ALJ56277.1 Protein translocase subunit SecD [Candidatus Xiphinematobacter sp. Idaho Grape]